MTNEEMADAQEGTVKQAVSLPDPAAEFATVVHGYVNILGNGVGRMLEILNKHSDRLEAEDWKAFAMAALELSHEIDSITRGLNEADIWNPAVLAAYHGGYVDGENRPPTPASEQPHEPESVAIERLEG